MGWREYAKTVSEAGHNSDNRHNRSPDDAAAPDVPVIRGLPSEDEARSILRGWHRHLSALDVYVVPAGIDCLRWAQIVLDSWDLYERHCSRLVREGWSALDLFGVFPNLPGGGGLADRLQGARNVLFVDGCAHWSRLGVKAYTYRGACDGFERSGMVLIWNLK